MNELDSREDADFESVEDFASTLFWIDTGQQHRDRDDLWSHMDMSVKQDLRKTTRALFALYPELAEAVGRRMVADDSHERGVAHLNLDKALPGSERPVIAADRIDPTIIPKQRAAGWPDFHPERYCHRCGNRNPVWTADADLWAIVSRAYLGHESHAGIVCPMCADELYTIATGKKSFWLFVRETVEPRTNHGKERR